jgi:hypothetical protein
VRVFVIALVALVAGLVALPAAAGPAATGDDISLAIHFGDNEGRPIAGTTANGLHFNLFFDVATTTGLIQPVTLSVGLPSGLHWGAIGPAPSDGCQGTAPAVCTASTASNGGTIEVGWGWNVIADAAGTYTVTATATPTQPDPNPANNMATFQFQVVVPAVTPTIAVTKPTVARTGSIVSATVHVTADGAPARATNVSRTAAVGGATLHGKAHSADGVASCRYTTPRSARDKTLHGTLTVSVDGTTLTRTFSIKLR